jgi:hypothetical protein
MFYFAIFLFSSFVRKIIIKSVFSSIRDILHFLSITMLFSKEENGDGILVSKSGRLEVDTIMCLRHLLSIPRIFVIYLLSKRCINKTLSDTISIYCSFKRYVNMIKYLPVLWFYSYPSEPH